MNKRYFILMRRVPSQSFLALILTVVFFAGGCIVGTISAGLVTQLSGLSDYLSTIILNLTGNSGASLSFFSVFIDTIFYHLIAFIFGFCVIGFLFVPILSAVRGYIFAFSVSLIVRYYGADGILPAFLLFGIKSIIATPCFVFLAIQSFCASMRLTSIAFSGTPNGISPYDSGYVIRCIICFAILALLTLVSYLLSNPIFNFILSTI